MSFKPQSKSRERFAKVGAKICRKETTRLRSVQVHIAMQLCSIAQLRHARGQPASLYMQVVELAA